jgi:hypothetical protein
MENTDLKNLSLKAIKKLEEIRLAASNFDITEEQLKVLNELVRFAVNFEMETNPKVDFDADLMRSNYVDRELLIRIPIIRLQ